MIHIKYKYSRQNPNNILFQLGFSSCLWSFIRFIREYLPKVFPEVSAEMNILCIFYPSCVKHKIDTIINTILLLYLYTLGRDLGSNLGKDSIHQSFILLLWLFVWFIRESKTIDIKYSRLILEKDYKQTNKRDILYGLFESICQGLSRGLCRDDYTMYILSFRRQA